METPTIRILHGEQIAPYLDTVAGLRIAVFRDWPYLYAGDPDYERRYLATYAQSPRSLFVLAEDGDEIVGASTAIPLADETAAIRTPFVEQGLEVGDVFYFGESVLLPRYRGLGLGHRFFDERERRARQLGFAETAFCSVVRAPDDPRRPPDHRPNDAFWQKRGYRQRPGLCCRIDWQELGDSAESSHELVFWTRTLEMRT